MSDHSRTFGIAVVAVLVAATTACADDGGDPTTASPTSTGTGGASAEKVVVVTIGTEEHDDYVAATMLRLLAAEVDRLSDGGVRVEPSFSVIGALGGGVAWDQRAIRLAADGAFDGVVARAGAWHGAGVTSLDVLQLPALIDTDIQADRLAADADAVSALLSGFEGSGFAGIGLYPEGPRYLMLLDDTTDFSPQALAGRTVRAPLSETVFDGLSAIGMHPVDLTSADFTVQVPEGVVTATEGHLGRVALTTTVDGDSDSVVGVNLPLYTKFLVLAVRTDSVPTEVLALLQEAARAVVDDFAAARPGQAEQLFDACRAGGVLVQIPTADRDALLELMQPVTDAFVTSGDGQLLDVVRSAVGSPDDTVWACP